jgi:hypothetical protein
LGVFTYHSPLVRKVTNLFKKTQSKNNPTCHKHNIPEFN